MQLQSVIWSIRDNSWQMFSYFTPPNSLYKLALWFWSSAHSSSLMCKCLRIGAFTPSFHPGIIWLPNVGLVCIVRVCVSSVVCE